jgi:PTH1 family peptidyl-tRNA hydrolase
MWLIVGLGNPGEKYAHTRHNAGYLAIDKLAKHWAVEQCQSKFHGLLASANDRWLFKPETFMNSSGQAVGELTAFYKLPVENIVGIHDDVDLPFGQIKVKRGGGSAGHHGLESIDRAVGTDYWRIRIGIGHPEGNGDVTDYVLSNFTSNELSQLDPITDQVIELVNKIINGQEETSE